MARTDKQQAIAEFLQPFYGGDEKLGVLLALSVGRLMMRASGEEAYRQAEFTYDRVQHVVDWLRSALINNARWLTNVDDLGRPKKLLKFATLAGLIAEVDRSMVIEAQKLNNVRIAAGEEELHANLDDGMVLVRLLTPAALDRESSEMQHCIGNGGYDHALDDPSRMFLSLRDRFGKAHATLEIDGNDVNQIQGKQNRLPVKKYIDLLAPFLQERQYQVKMPATYLGYVIDIDGQWHDIKNLPDQLHVKGTLSLGGTDTVSLPKSLRVGGRLIVTGTGIKSLPEDLNVEGTLDIVNSAITSLPNRIRVGDSLYLNSNITELPSNLYVGGSLWLRGSLMKSLPKGLVVCETLDIIDTVIDHLPDDLKVFGGLDIRNTTIGNIPEGVMPRWIKLTDSGVDTLPNHILDTTRIIIGVDDITAKEFRIKAKSEPAVRFMDRLAERLRGAICVR
jgi:hypothetical protein